MTPSDGRKSILDAVIIGGGPAGLAAGLHLARAGRKALLVERAALGGQARSIALLENYPGFPGGVPGAKLMKIWAAQAASWGLKAKTGEAVAAARNSAGLFSVRLKRGGTLKTRCVLWCGGAGFRRLGVPGESDFAGRGVWNTADEAPSYAGKTVAVVGSGEAALQQAALLARSAGRVYLITRSGRLKAHKLLRERFCNSGALWLPGFRVASLLGGGRLKAAELETVAGSREKVKLELDALFVLVGKEPRKVPAAWARPPAGFFEAGDAASGIYRQVAVAGGDGIRAAMRCVRYLEEL
ncbi:MAG: hypothetical protein A2089_12240 [Elusimicrobia bacterium GWD2_63_28]|nr:MAG: hypothetical protein A2089_12240 [Elusimicrobia bacterium GWD2_63_28]